MHIVRYRDLTPSPWRNGGGVTREIVRQPAAGRFRWRLSVAEVGESGPFSEFAGYRRIMLLLEGRGVRLHFGDGTARALRTPGEMLEFSGTIATVGELIDGPCVDLNLIIEETLAVPQVEVVELEAGAPLRLRRVGAGMAETAGGPSLVVVLRGAAALVPAQEGRGPLELGRWDTALIEAQERETVVAAGLGHGAERAAAAAAKASAPEAPGALVFIARLGAGS